MMQPGAARRSRTTTPYNYRRALNGQLAAKRLLDIVLSATGLLVFGLLIAICALLVRLTSPGPAFFVWRIVGQGGRPVLSYKLRTMFVGADKMRDQLQSQNEVTGPYFKIKHDPRVSPVGRVLRRYSIDELPQFWSILKGDMSLVGPRPAQVFEYEKLNQWQRQRVQVKPGAVSSWIVGGKTADFDEMVRKDLAYIETWSFVADLKILVQAVPYLLLGKNT